MVIVGRPFSIDVDQAFTRCLFRSVERLVCNSEIVGREHVYCVSSFHDFLLLQRSAQVRLQRCNAGQSVEHAFRAKVTSCQLEPASLLANFPNRTQCAFLGDRIKRRLLLILYAC